MKNPLVPIILVSLATYIGIQKNHGNHAGGLCFGTGCGRNPVTRTLLPESLEFKVAGSYDAGSETWDAVHTFKLGPFQTLKGAGFDYRVSPVSDFGEDAKCFYLPPAALASYRSEYLQTGKECPASFIVQNMRIYMLVGATPEISEKLLSSKFKFEYGGTPFAYEGHPMAYESSLANGSQTQLVPTRYETAFSRAGQAHILYDYFLVTGFAVPDAGLPNPENRKPASVDIK